jgi:hypothetical protein
MIIGEQVDKVIDEFHGKYWGVNEGQFKVTDYLKQKGIEFTLCDFETRIDREGVYLVTVPSLNIEGGNHQIIWALEAAEQDGYFYQYLFDPAYGREDKKYYTNIDELLVSDSLARKINGYSVDLHISKEFMINFKERIK